MKKILLTILKVILATVLALPVMLIFGIAVMSVEWEQCKINYDRNVRGKENINA